MGTVYLLREMGGRPVLFEQALRENSKHGAAALGRLESMVRLGRVDAALLELNPFSRNVRRRLGHRSADLCTTGSCR